MTTDMQQVKKDQPYIISGYCRIRNNSVSGSHYSLTDKDAPADLTDFLRYLYDSLQLNYPKFFKMDNLSKLAFLTTEIVIKNTSLAKYAQEEIGVVLANSFATLDTDKRYCATINDKNNYFPSPSLFVYTLPNIMIGEICIRHKIKGENAFFVFKEFNHNFISKYVIDLFATGKINCCITGWVDLRETDYESVLFFVERKSSDSENMPYTTENTKKIYSA